MEEALKIDWPVHGKNERWVEFERAGETIHDFGMSAGFDFEADGPAFPALRDLRVHGVEQAARFFLFEVEIAVAGDAERSGSEDFVAAIELWGIRGNDVVQKNVVNCIVRGGNTEKTRQGARNGNHAEKRFGICSTLTAQEK